VSTEPQLSGAHPVTDAAAPEASMGGGQGQAETHRRTGPVVSLRGVGKTFGLGTKDEFCALQDFNLDIHAGEFVSLLGPSGCGKSTLLRLIADLLQPSEGEVGVLGGSASEARTKRGYGMVFQHSTLFDWRTVSSNVELPLQLMGQGKRERSQRAAEMLELVKLTGFASRYPWQLSGGMQQRVSIARALAFDPPLLLMDEPFGALDEMTREHMQMELLAIWQRLGTTVVFVTHSIPEAAFLSQRVILMATNPGRLSAEINVDLPYPRNEDTREDPAYFDVLTRVREGLRGKSGD